MATILLPELSPCTQVMSAMMLAMVASAVVSTVSLSAVMVQRAQEAATPSPAAQLAALINTPSPTPRCISHKQSLGPMLDVHRYQKPAQSHKHLISWMKPHASFANPSASHAGESKGKSAVCTTLSSDEIE